MKSKMIALLLLTSFASAANGPVVVELFTSQGCSSCPPAENLLDFLQERYRDRILPLAFHVDYWDELGWVDPYASKENTQRQREYRDTLKEKNLYTPQMVVQGRWGFLGSDRHEAEKAIAAAQELAPPAIELTQTGITGTEATFTLKLPDSISATSDRVVVVVFENAPAVMVDKGENAHHRMTGDFAVRKFFALPPATLGHFEISVPLDKEWARPKTGVAVLVQDLARHILAAQSVYPLEAAHAK
jgi:hypothetical protein